MLLQGFYLPVARACKERWVVFTTPDTALSSSWWDKDFWYYHKPTSTFVEVMVVANERVLTPARHLRRLPGAPTRIACVICSLAGAEQTATTTTALPTAPTESAAEKVAEDLD